MREPAWRAALDPTEHERLDDLDDALGLCLSEAALAHCLTDPRGLLFQRLEFVGDSLLDAATVRALLLRERWDDAGLGELAHDRQAMVSDRALIRTARHARLPAVRSFRPSPQRLGDRIEACVGAAWADAGVDGGVSVAHRLVIDPALADEPERPLHLPRRIESDLLAALRDGVERALDHRVGRPGWLVWALDGEAQRRRLAQLGDAVLETAAASALYEAHPYATEGELTDLRQRIQTNHRVAAFGARLGLHGTHPASRGGHARRTRDAERDAADSVQAVVGAIAMDAGISAAVRAGRRVLGLPPEDVVRRRWHP